LLGAPPEATAEQIFAAYRMLVQLFHPDRLSHLKPVSRAIAEERIEALNQANAVLGDPARRAAYDNANSSRRGTAASPRLAPGGRPTGW
jgi:curved DNA-binding protein CbpA